MDLVHSRMHLFADSSHVVEGFLKSWGMILASEIGDKTFFIAAIMAMKHSRAVVTFPSLFALQHVLCQLTVVL